MSSMFSSHNLISWLVQVSLIALCGTLLPFLLKIRHPKTQLAYCHAVLITCILLPLVQPWQHPFFIFRDLAAPAPGAPGIDWATVVEWVIAAGIVARLCWLGAGLRQIRGLRAGAIPLHPIPDSIRYARSLTRADAVVRISSHVGGPATLGYVDPVILLPQSFMSLNADAQLSIACHELLHVRRSDWIVSVVEEAVGALFWFNPVMWWLLSQTKLSREQLVDSEVVGLTAKRAPYVEALLSMAVTAKQSTSVPAAAFFAEGHLAQRVRALLTQRRASAVRLLASYGAISCLLVAAAWAAVVFFPFMGNAQILTAASPTELLPPSLHVWRTVPARGEKTVKFNLPVPPPDSETKRDTFFFALRANSELPADVPGPLHFLATRGIRVIRPGDKATPEEIVRMKEALGDRAVLEVTQTEDGTVQRITILGRRISDETTVDPFDYVPGTGGTIPADPAGASESGNRIH